MSEQIYFVMGGSGFGKSTVGEILAKELNIPYKKIRSITTHLINHNRLQRFEKHFIHQQHIDSGKAKMLAHFEKDNSGLTVAAYRDIIEGKVTGTCAAAMVGTKWHEEVTSVHRH